MRGPISFTLNNVELLSYRLDFRRQVHMAYFSFGIFLKL